MTTPEALPSDEQEPAKPKGSRLLCAKLERSAPTARDEREGRGPRGQTCQSRAPALAGEGGAGGRVTVGKGDETAVIARIPRESMESAGIPPVEAVARPRLFSAVVAGFEGFERTSENRGVPGSSPGLAIAKRPMNVRFPAIGWDADRQMNWGRSPFRATHRRPDPCPHGHLAKPFEGAERRVLVDLVPSAWNPFSSALSRCSLYRGAVASRPYADTPARRPLRASRAWRAACSLACVGDIQDESWLRVGQVPPISRRQRRLGSPCARRRAGGR
jgi:hypothetical protein